MPIITQIKDKYFFLILISQRRKINEVRMCLLSCVVIYRLKCDLMISPLSRLFDHTHMLQLATSIGRGQLVGVTGIGRGHDLHGVCGGRGGGGGGPGGEICDLFHH